MSSLPVCAVVLDGGIREQAARSRICRVLATEFSHAAHAPIVFPVSPDQRATSCAALRIRIEGRWQQTPGGGRGARARIHLLNTS
jgi:hypothetical protein